MLSAALRGKERQPPGGAQVGGRGALAERGVGPRARERKGGWTEMGEADGWS